MDSERRLFFRIWIFALLAKIIIGIVFPFTPDEAYYWTWSHNIQWSYFDHPPFIAWLFWLGHPFENIGQGSRVPGIILSHCGLLIWREILRPYLSSRQLIYFLMIALASPMIGAGSILMTPDLPLVFSGAWRSWRISDIYKKILLSELRSWGSCWV